MKILILGSSGVLGTALIRVCKINSLDFIALNHNDIEATKKEELEAVIINHAPTVIINCIAMVGINPCEEEMLKAFEVNTIIPYTLAQLCHEKNITFIHVSSHAVFDGESNNFYTEHDMYNPTNIYGMAKASADTLVSNVCAKYYIFRVPTMFGERRNDAMGFVDKMIEFMEKKESISVADDKIDTPTYSLDVATEMINVLMQGKSFGLYHIANRGRVSYYEFICKVKDILGLQCDIKRAKDNDFEALAHKPLKTSMLSIKLNALRSWEEALEDYLKGKK